MNDYPPEYDYDDLCGICGTDPAICECPECPKCGVVGDLTCFGSHMPYPPNSVHAFIDFIGVAETLGDTLRLIDKHNVHHVAIVLKNGLTIRYWDKINGEFPEPMKGDIVVGVGLGGIAWDGSDWEYYRTAPIDATGNFDEMLKDLEADFDDNLAWHKSIED